MFIHEGLFFGLGFLGLAVALFAIEQKQTVWSYWLPMLLMIGLGSIAAFTSYLGRDVSTVAGQLCTRISSAGGPEGICQHYGLLDTEVTGGFYAVERLVTSGGYVTHFSAAAAIALLPFALIRFSRKMLFLATLSALPLLALFLLAIDWGRWIVILATSLALILVRFEGLPGLEMRANRQNVGLPGTLFILAYVLLWAVPSNDAERFHTGILGQLAQLLA